MTDFQIALVVIGALVLVGVLGFNWYQERRARPAPAPAPARRQDTSRAPGKGTGRARAGDGQTDESSGSAIEHHLGESPRADAAAGARPAQTPTVERPAAESGAEPVSSPGSLPGSPAEPALDPRIDYIAEIVFSDEHDGEEVLRVAADELRAQRHVAWEGWSARREVWEHLSPSRQYERVRVGLQLLDRRGSVREDELRAFCESLQSMGTSLVGEIDFAPRGESLRAAAEMDRQIADLDIQVGLSIIRRTGHPFAASLIAQVVALSSGGLGSDGRFHVPAAGGADRLWVANLEAVPFRLDDLSTQGSRGVTVAMDVARAPDEATGFDEFVAFARDLARVLEGELVDDDHRPVSDDALGAIKDEVDRVRGRLAALGVPAGSALALRLFA